MSDNSSSRFIRHSACPSCESSDALAVYDDHEHCFSCNYDKQYKEKNEAPSEARSFSPMNEIAFDLTEPHRGLDKRTLDSYGIGFKDGFIVYQYRDRNGQHVAQKIRAIEPGDDGKRLTQWRGSAKEATGFGQHLANPAKHKAIVICEGELDAPSVYQAFGGKVAAISVPNGAQSAGKFVRDHLDEFLKFESVIVCTDNDEPGNAAATQIMGLFEPGKVKRAVLPCKDANDTLQEMGSHVLKEAVEAAREIRPDGIRPASDYAGLVLKPPDRRATDCAFAFWNQKCPFYDNQLIILIAGSGIGKTTFARTLCLHDMERGIKCGWIGLEETAEEAVFRFVGAAAGIQLHARQSYGELNPQQLLDIEQADRFVTGSGMLELFDHFGSLDEESILNRMNYMVRSLACQHIYLDHLTIIGSGLAQDTRHLDSLITKIRSFIAATKCTVFAISHLSRSPGQNFENGDIPELQNIRNSHSIVQLGDTIWALGRKRGTQLTHSHCLKNRMLGRLGYAGSFEFDEGTQRLDHKWVDQASSF
jgi:twinkle protein